MNLKIYGTDNGMKEIGYRLELGFGSGFDGSVYVPEDLTDIEEIEKLAILDALDRDGLTIELEED
jgi:hypothetical protein